jgi:IS1 family transposase
MPSRVVAHDLWRDWIPIFVFIEPRDPGNPVDSEGKSNIAHFFESVSVGYDSPHSKALCGTASLNSLYLIIRDPIGDATFENPHRPRSHEADTTTSAAVRQRERKVFRKRYWHDLRSGPKGDIVGRCVTVIFQDCVGFKGMVGILKDSRLERNRQISPALQLSGEFLHIGNLPAYTNAFPHRFDVGRHGCGDSFHGRGSPRCFSNGSFYFGGLLSAGRSGFRQLLLHQVGLAVDLPKGSISGINATPTDYYQKASKNRYGDCGAYRPSINLSFVIFICLTLGGFLWSVFVPFWIDDKRRILRTSAVCFGLGLSEGGILFFIASGFFPYTWGLPPNWIPERWNPCKQSKSQQEPAHRVNVSQKLLLYPGFVYYNNYMPNVISTDKQIAIIASLCEGSSIRSIERITGVHRDTIMRLGVKIGKGCTAMMGTKMRNLECHRLDMDEIWGFVGKKDRHLSPDDDPQFGNVWTFCAIDADTKLVPAFRVSKDRDINTATAFALDVADRMKNRVQISTDGLAAYVEAIDWAFGGNVDYGQIIKTYGTEESIEAQRRYSAPAIKSIEKKAIFGRPEFDLISTSYVERLNATTRLHMKRLARLTHAFSKKRENFEAAVGLHFAYYNFVRRHNTLRCTPAMEAGIEQSFWSVGDLLEAAA